MATSTGPGALPARSAPEPPTDGSVVTDEILEAQRWALDHDRHALLEHRLAVFTQASWEVQEETERRLLHRYRRACSTFGNFCPG